MALSPVRRRWLLLETVVFALPTTLVPATHLLLERAAA
jgi:hypothetical protein